ncbi:MAG: hypothetical protein ABIS10_06990 [Novosphingobium sp.]
MIERWYSKLAVSGLLLSIAAGMFLPVYTDEIGWRFQERAWIDGVDMMVNDLCGPNTLARPPWFMMPVRWFSAMANQAYADPLFIRIEGLACALGWIALLWGLTARLEGDATKLSQLRSLIFSLLGLGTLPFLMVLSRPEQPLILTLLLMILLVFVRAPALDSRILAWRKTTAIVLLAGVAVSYHVKGVAYAPVALGCIAVSGKGRETLAPRLAGAGALTALMLAAANYWVGRFQCPGDAKMAASLARENISYVIANHGQLSDVLLQLVSGINPLNYVWLAAPDNQPMSNWIPGDLFPVPVFYAIASALTLLWVSTFILSLAILARFLRLERLRGLAEPRVILALAILACMLVWGASQVNRNPYEAAHVLPMLAVFSALCLTLPAPETSLPMRGLVRLVRFAVPAAVLCEAALLVFTGGPLLRAARTPGYLADQRYSVSIAGYAGVKQDIDRAMAKAGIPSSRRLHRLLLDDVTYLALQRHLMPLHRLGVLEVWNGSIDNPAQYLDDRGSDGVVVSCANLPLHMEMAAARSGGICAINRAILVQLAAPPPDIWADDPSAQ